MTWVETRSENMVAMAHGRAQVQTVTIGGDRDGRIRAYRLEILQDAGAYPKFGAFAFDATTGTRTRRSGARPLHDAARANAITPKLMREYGSH